MENRIKEVIQKEGKKQKWIADKIGVSETDISSYDNNYFANNVLVTVNKGPQNNEQEHR